MREIIMSMPAALGCIPSARLEISARPPRREKTDKAPHHICARDRDIWRQKLAIGRPKLAGQHSGQQNLQAPRARFFDDLRQIRARHIGLMPRKASLAPSSIIWHRPHPARPSQSGPARRTCIARHPAIDDTHRQPARANSFQFWRETVCRCQPVACGQAVAQCHQFTSCLPLGLARR